MSICIQSVHPTAFRAPTVRRSDQPCARRVCPDTRIDSAMDSAIVSISFLNLPVNISWSIDV